jgi:hypothetical protein
MLDVKLLKSVPIKEIAKAIIQNKGQEIILQNPRLSLIVRLEIQPILLRWYVPILFPELIDYHPGSNLR